MSVGMQNINLKGGKDMLNKITYDNGKIRSGFDTFNCDDDVDMEILCNKVNAIFVENAIEIDKMNTQLQLIKKALGLKREV